MFDWDVPLFGIVIALQLAMFAIPAAGLLAQHRSRLLESWFGSQPVFCCCDSVGAPAAFVFYTLLMRTLWMAWLLSMFALYGSQFDRMSHWDASSISMSIFSYVFGCFLAVCGGLLYLWGMYALGSKRSAGLNFFEPNVPIESESLVYRLFVHPQDVGLTMLYAGATLMSTCWSAVFLFCIFVVCMVLFQRVESLPITHPADQCPPLEQPKQMFVALNAFTEAVDDHVTDDQL